MSLILQLLKTWANRCFLSYLSIPSFARSRCLRHLFHQSTPFHQKLKKSSKVSDFLSAGLILSRSDGDMAPSLSSNNDADALFEAPPNKSLPNASSPNR